MLFLFTIFIFILGLIVGSFLSAVIYSVKEGRKFTSRRSICPHCHHKIPWYDLIPLLSYIILLGKCRHCHEKISIIYPLIELINGICFVAIFLKFLPPRLDFFDIFTLALYLFLTTLLILVFFFDLKYSIIPDNATILVISATAIIAIIDYQNLLNYLIGAAIFGGFLTFLYYFSRGKWIGFGDVKLAFALGLGLIWPCSILTVVLAFTIGATISILLILTRKKKRTDVIPFATFMTTAFFITLLFGQEIINWYVSYLDFEFIIK